MKKTKLSFKNKTACLTKKNYPTNMKIPGEHLQMVSNQCTNLRKIHTPISQNACGQNHVHRQGTDRRTDSRTG